MGKRLNESTTKRLGERLAEGVLREMNESNNWRDKHVRPNSPEFENWAAQALAQGASPGYINHWRELDSWTGGGAEKNGLVDFSSGRPTLRKDALAEFQNGDNNWFKRNNSKERNDWLNRHLSGIGNEESYWWPRTVRGGYPPYGGGYPQRPSNGGGDDRLVNMLIMSEIMKAMQTARNEAAAHPDMAAGAPKFPMWIWAMVMNNGSGGRMMPPMGGGMRPPMGGGMRPPMGGGMRPPMGGGMRPPMGGGMRPPMGGGMRPPIIGGTRPFGSK